MFKKFAFTLAEVLIVIGIIGVIATITIPPLVQKQQEQQTVVALKKAYSTLSNAYTLAVQENGTPENWGLGAGGSISPTILNNLKPYLRVDKDCTDGSQGCWPTGVTYKSINGDAASVCTRT